MFPAVDLDTFEPVDAVHPRALDRHLAFERHAERGEKSDSGCKVLDDDADVGLPASHRDEGGGRNACFGATTGQSPSRRQTVNLNKRRREDVSFLPSDEVLGR